MQYQELAAACRAWRIREKIPQRVIAETAGTSIQAVCQFEAGRCNSLRIYLSYLSNGFELADRMAAAEAMTEEVFGIGKAT